MPLPSKIKKIFSFRDFSALKPNSPLPGDEVDNSFSAVYRAFNALLDHLGTVIRADGNLANGSVGREQLQDGLFDDITGELRREVQPDIELNALQARIAESAARSAGESASVAVSAVDGVRVSASLAVEARFAAEAAARVAADVGDDAVSKATDAENSADHALESERRSEMFAVLSAHWAEHMPGTIPENILAEMDITGDHWSSRWWAHRAGEIIQEEIKDLCSVYVGAYASPPATCSHGDPLVVGALYWNTGTEQMYVWTGDEWRALVLPSPGDLQEFHYTTTGGGLIGGTDMFGRVPGDLLSPSCNTNVYLNGVRLLEANDWYVADATHVRLSRVPATGSVVTVERMDAPQTVYAATAGKIDTGLWTFDGISKSFPIYVNGGLVSPANAANVLVELDRRMQEAAVDYRVVGSNIIFTEAPAPGTNAWGLVGMPLGPDEIGVLVPSPSAYGRYTYAAVADGQVYFGGMDKFGNELKGLLAPNSFVNVHVNGVRIEDDEYELASDVELKLDRGVAYGTSVVIELSQVAKLNFTLPPLVASTAYKLDTDKWVFDGVTTTFPILVNGVPFAPTSEVGINLSLAGVMQEPVDDFIVSGTDLTFSTAPPYDSDCWAIIGVATSGMKEHNHDCGVFG
jgi:hypothetical protein